MELEKLQCLGQRKQNLRNLDLHHQGCSSKSSARRLTDFLPSRSSKRKCFYHLQEKIIFISRLHNKYSKNFYARIRRNCDNVPLETGTAMRTSSNTKCKNPFQFDAEKQKQLAQVKTASPSGM